MLEIQEAYPDTIPLKSALNRIVAFARYFRSFSLEWTSLIKYSQRTLF